MNVFLFDILWLITFVFDLLSSLNSTNCIFANWNDAFLDAGVNPTANLNMEERLVQALRVLEREHRARQEAEIELGNVRQQLLTATLLANQNKDTMGDNSSISPRDDSELATRLQLLQYVPSYSY